MSSVPTSNTSRDRAKAGVRKAGASLPELDLIRGVPNSVLFGALLIVVSVVIVYLPAIHAGYIWDDNAYVTANPLLAAPDGLWRIWFSTQQPSQYFPLVYTTLRFEHALWGFNPLGYHLVNVLIHCANALLAWMLLRRLNVPGAWLAAAVFALHPVQVETVAWITELKNTESTFFYLLALLAWMKFAEDRSARPWKFYVLALGFHACALFSKTTACTLPAAMVLVLWLRGQRIGWRRLAQIVPFLLMGLFMGLVSVWWERHLGNLVAGSGVHMSLLDRGLVATRALWFYTGKVFWPAKLTFSYPRWNINPQELSQYGWGLGCIAVALLLWWRRRSIGRGPIVAVVFFVAALSPMLGFFPLYTFRYTFVADHYQYLACLGLIALVIGGLAKRAEKWRVNLQMQGTFCLALLATLGTLTWHQAHAYRTPETLWRDTLRKNPDSWLAHNDLAMTLVAQGNRTEAETQFEDALRLNPDDADIHYNFANLLLSLGRTDEAISHYRRAEELRPTDPDIHNNFGVALYSAKRFAEAAAQFREVVREKPDSPKARCNLGNALLAQGHREAAAREYAEALRLDPNFAEAKNRLRALGLPVSPGR